MSQRIMEAFHSATRSLGRNMRYMRAMEHRARLINSGEYVRTSEQLRLAVEWRDAWEQVAALALRAQEDS